METKLFFVIFQLFPLKLKLIIYTLFFLIYFAFCHENKGVWFTVRFLQFSKISPILVGQWGAPFANRPSLEAQMQAIRTAFPSINSISHFAFSWQNEQLAFTRSRQFCNLSR